MTWVIIAMACMVNDPGDCWEWKSPKPFHSLTECRRVLDNPITFGYTSDYPMKVEGAIWFVEPMCVGTVQL